MFTGYAGEQLISELSSMLCVMVDDISMDEIKNKLSRIVSKYHVQKVEEEEIHPDLHEKINLFISTKNLEGLSKLTLEGYKLELRLFSESVRKHAANITAADIRVYLGNQKGLKMSTIGRKLSVLKSFFGWLHSEEVIHRDPTDHLRLKNDYPKH